MEKLPFFNAVRVFNNSLVSSALVVAPLAVRVFPDCSYIVPLADSEYIEIVSIAGRQEPFPIKGCAAARRRSIDHWIAHGHPEAGPHTRWAIGQCINKSNSRSG